MTTTPSTLTGSPMLANYGCASIADASGNLLFYTNGETVYSKTHTVMANGSGLHGYQYNAQPALIVPKPGSATNYYIFTLNSWNIQSVTHGLYCSEVDMSLSAGHGSVISKNVAVYTGSVSGKLTGTKHCNGIDYWVVIRDWTWNSSTSNFRAYQVTSTGPSTAAVVSSASSWTNNINYYDQYGNMKLAPNGKKLALANYNNWGWQNTNWHTFEVWDFDNTTGAVTNSLALHTWTMTNTWSGGWGVEFSPDGTKLYGSRLNNNIQNSAAVLQWDLCAGSGTAIAASQFVVATHSTSTWNGHGNLQLAPNGKIYCANWWSSTNSQSISVINSPNSAGAACSYSYLSQNVAPGNSTYSLPNFITSLFIQPPPMPPYTYTVSNGLGCQAVGFTSPIAPSQTVTGCSVTGYSLTNLVWNFGDPNSGAANTSTLTNPVHAFTSLGNHTVKLILYYSCGGGTDTISQIVNVNLPCISVTSTSITCANLGSATVVPTGGIGPFSYTWMPSAQTGSAATGLSPGAYTLTVFDFGNNFTYTAQTIFTSLIPLTGTLYNASSVTCHGASTASATVSELAGGSGTVTYLWRNSTTTLTADTAYLSAGLWSVTVTDALTGCQVNDLFIVTQPPALNLNLSTNSPSVCTGFNVALSGTTSGGTPGLITPYTYSWTGGPPASTYTISQNLAGNATYTLDSRDSLNCLIRSTITITHVPNPVLSLPAVSICPLETGTLQVSGATTYTWFDSSNLNTFSASPNATTIYSVIGSALGCTTSASAPIVVKPVPMAFFGSNGPRCNGQDLQVFGLGGQSYYWTGPQSFTSNVQYPVIINANPLHSGLYVFTVTAVNGCTASTGGTVMVHPTPTVSAAGSTVCVTQTMQLFGSSEPGATFNWSGPGNYGSTAEDPQFPNPTVPMSGNYQLLVHSVHGCSNTAIANVSVTAVPVPTFNMNSPLCEGASLNFNSNATTGATNYQWYGPDGFASQIPNPSIPVVGMQSAGNYTLIVTTGPCVSAISKNAVINPLPVPQISAPVSVCHRKPLQLVVNTPGHQIVNYLWVYPFGGSSNQQVNFDSTNFQNSGVYNATVTDNHGCKGSTSHQVVILPNPTLTVLNDTVCRGNAAMLRVSGAADYLWKGPNLSVDYGAEAHVHTAENIAPEMYTVMGTAVNGCTSVANGFVHTTDLPVPVLTVLSGTRLCVNDEVRLRGGGGVSYEWRLPQSFVYRGREIKVVLDNMYMAGTYTMVVTDAGGCVNYTTAAIELDPLPSGHLSTMNWSGCVPFCRTFNFETYGFSADVTAQWTLDKKTNLGNTFSNCFTQSGSYTVKGNLLDTITGCKNDVTYTVNAYDQPKASFTWKPERPVETFDEVLFMNESIGPGQSQWTWHIEGASEDVNKEQLRHTFQQAGNYRVVLIVEDEHGCADTVLKVVEVDPDFHLYVPDAFTPNTDGLNEGFKAVGRGIKRYQIDVFNRWGDRLFSSDKVDQAWDGYHHGILCPQGAYVWKITLTTQQGELKEYSGHVLLLK